MFPIPLGYLAHLRPYQGAMALQPLLFVYLLLGRLNRKMLLPKHSIFTSLVVLYTCNNAIVISSMCILLASKNFTTKKLATLSFFLLHSLSS